MSFIVNLKLSVNFLSAFKASASSLETVILEFSDLVYKFVFNDDDLEWHHEDSSTSAELNSESSFDHSSSSLCDFRFACFTGFVDLDDTSSLSHSLTSRFFIRVDRDFKLVL